MRPRWKRTNTQPSHSDDWLITYADMITLLLCFFVSVFILSIARKDAAPKLAIAPIAPATTQIPPPQPTPAVHWQEALRRSLPPRHRDETDAEEEPEAGSAKAVAAAAPQAAAPAPQAPGANDATPRSNNSATLVPPPELADVAPSAAPADRTPKGDRITIREIDSATFFASGSARLSEDGKTILRNVAATLVSDDASGYRITVEGHTDDTPINTTEFPSNWELSAARAASVVHFFLELGVPAQRLRAAGYADNFPKAPNRDAENNPIPENQAQNRRVVIKLERIEKARDQ